VSSCTASDVEHPPPRLEREASENKVDGTFCIPIITMRIQPQVLFAKPFFEPFHVS
jgi:hypothetical protein